jgi:hypothetical protein
MPNLFELRRSREMSGAVLARVRLGLKVRQGDRHPRTRAGPHLAQSSGEVVDAGYFLLQ